MKNQSQKNPFEPSQNEFGDLKASKYKNILSQYQYPEPLVSHLDGPFNFPSLNGRREETHSEEESGEPTPIKKEVRLLNSRWKSLLVEMRTGSKQTSKKRNMRSIGYKTLAPVSFSTLKFNDCQV